MTSQCGVTLAWTHHDCTSKVLLYHAASGMISGGLLMDCYEMKVSSGYDQFVLAHCQDHLLKCQA